MSKLTGGLHAAGQGPHVVAGAQQLAAPARQLRRRAHCVLLEGACVQPVLHLAVLKKRMLSMQERGS
jgi:acetyl-CoA acetyltransferase